MPAAPRIEITELQRNALFHLNFASRDVHKNNQFVVSLPTQQNRLMTDGAKIIMSSSRRGMFTHLKSELQVGLIPGPYSATAPQNVTWFNRNIQIATNWDQQNSTIKSDRVTGIAIKVNDNWLEFPFTDGPVFFQSMLPEVQPVDYGSATYHTQWRIYRNNQYSNRQRVNKVSTLCRKAADSIIEQLETLGVIRIQTYQDYVNGVVPVNLTWNEGPEPEDDGPE